MLIVGIILRQMSRKTIERLLTNEQLADDEFCQLAYELMDRDQYRHFLAPFEVFP